MTKAELVEKHLEKIKEGERSQMPCDTVLGHMEISIEFAIEILKELRVDMSNTTVGWRTLKIDHKIAKLQNDIL